MDETEAIAQLIRAALDVADLDAFAELLDPRVTWGAPGDPSPPCQSREQVLAWYRQGQADGRRAHVLDVSSHGDKIVVSMKVTSPSPAGPSFETDRWQVLTITHGRVTDIRGYDVQADALAAAGFAD